MARKRATWKPGEAFVEGFADQLQVPDGKRDVIVWDAALPGFGCRKFVSGRASYIVQYDFAGATRRLSLGAVLDGNLKTMRLSANAVLSKRNLGQDAVAEKLAAIAASAGPTLGSLVPDYLKARKVEMKPRLPPALSAFP